MEEEVLRVCLSRDPDTQGGGGRGEGATMTTPFTGLFIDASCNSWSSVCVECLIGKQKKPILFKVAEPSSIPHSHGQVHTVQYRTITTGTELWGPFLLLL